MAKKWKILTIFILIPVLLFFFAICDLCIWSYPCGYLLCTIICNAYKYLWIESTWNDLFMFEVTHYPFDTLLAQCIFQSYKIGIRKHIFTYCRPFFLINPCSQKWLRRKLRTKELVFHTYMESKSTIFILF